MKKTIFAITVILIFTSLSFAQDTTPPGQITTLEATGGGEQQQQVTLTWLEPGDDGYSGYLINGQNEIVISSFSTCDPINDSIFAIRLLISSAAPNSIHNFTWQCHSNAPPGLLLPETTYYIWIRTADAIFNENWSVWSDTVSVFVKPDNSPPSAPAQVRDSIGADISFTYSTFSLSANWDLSIDTESGISQYDCCIGTTLGDTNVLNWTSVSVSTWVTRSNLVLTIGTTYYFGVRAVNGKGLTGNATNSDGQYVVKVDTTDTTPPGAPASVRDGIGADIDWVDVTMPMLPCNYCESCLNGGYMSTSLSANWDASTDLESGIAKYWYALGTTAGGTDIVGWTNKGTALTANYNDGYLLTNGTTYYFSVKAENGEGLHSAITSSNGQYVIKRNDYYHGPELTVHPNPYKVGEGYGTITFSNIPNESTIKIFNLSGDLVKIIQNASMYVSWDIKNESGGQLPSGIYTYVITNPQGEKKTGKIAIIR